jgi:hypothetical protein
LENTGARNAHCPLQKLRLDIGLQELKKGILLLVSSVIGNTESPSLLFLNWVIASISLEPWNPATNMIAKIFLPFLRMKLTSFVFVSLFKPP